MAVTKAQDSPMEGVNRIVVTLSAENDVANFEMPRCTAISIQVSGTFNGSTLTLNASNDGVTYAVLPTTADLSAAGMMSVALADLGFRFYQLAVTVASPTGALTCTVIGMEAR